MPLPRWVALSGGPDSVCLLHAMLQLRSAMGDSYPIVALHCNFHLRGDESDRDEKFCRDLCRMLDVELIVKEFDTYTYMKQEGLSLEMAARELRYNWFEQMRASDVDYIGIGHHADDSIETMLMNLMRGTGINGLTGIVPVNNEKHVVRPLLCLSRADVLQYLKDFVPFPEGWNCNYITDHTNMENDTLRNQIRNQLIPLMEQMVPHTCRGLLNTMSHIHEAAEFIDEQSEHLIHSHMSHHTIDGFRYDTIDVRYRSDSERNFIMRYFDRKGFSLDTRHDPWVLTTDQSLPTEHVPNPSAGIAPERFDADKVEQPIIWRRWRHGDRIDPLGMNGKTRKLSDLFTDAHYLPIQKQLAWVVTDAKDRILWVPGLKRCDFAKVTPLTENVLTLEY